MQPCGNNTASLRLIFLYVFFSCLVALQEGLRTGDLLIFQRGMPQEFSSRSVLSFLSRAASNSPWDHLAVVVRDHDPKNDVPYILEAGMNGVQVWRACKR